MKISLLGYMGSGKSTIGRKLADKLNLEFIDLDSYLEKVHQKTIPDIFKSLGEIKFRKSEREGLIQILNEKDNFVLAVGGGTPVYYDNIRLIEESTLSFYLRHTVVGLAERLKLEKESRPLIAHLEDADLPEYIGKHLFERRSFYEKSKFTINIGNKTPDEITDEIVNCLQVK